MNPEKSVLITGASSGLGKEMVTHFCKDHFVFGLSRRGNPVNHPNYFDIIGDLTKEEDVNWLMLNINEKTNRLDFLINNAAIASMNHMLTTPLASFRDILEVNLLSPFQLIRTCTQFLRKSPSASVVNISSIAASIEIEGELAYSVSKSALEKMTKLSAIELEPFHIRVNAIALPPMDTNLIKGVPKEKIQAIRNRQIQTKPLAIEQILNCLDFLLSEKSNCITGEVLHLGGVK